MKSLRYVLVATGRSARDPRVKLTTGSGRHSRSTSARPAARFSSGQGGPARGQGSYYWKSHFLEEILGDAIEVTAGHFASVPSPRSLIGFQQFGGAVSRVGRSETAFRHRQAQYDNFAASVWTDRGELEKHQQWVRQWWELMAPFSIGAEYVNNLGEEGEDRVRAAYGENYGRLVRLKDQYDPANFFRLNANIQPSG